MNFVQALDGAFNQENREKCKAATGPLIEAVDNLTAFASNPEFASIPAQISPEVGLDLNTSAHTDELMNAYSSVVVKSSTSEAECKSPPFEAKAESNSLHYDLMSEFGFSRH